LRAIPTVARSFAKLAASGALSGYSPFAPGTAGSLVGLLAFLCFRGLSGPLWFSIAAVTFVLGVPLSSYAEKLWGKDSPRIVIDEIVGLWVAISITDGSGPSIFVGFLLFRLFDVVKPPPAGASQSLPGGWGVMADDLIAGVYAGVATRIAVSSIGGWL